MFRKSRLTDARLKEPLFKVQDGRCAGCSVHLDIDKLEIVAVDNGQYELRCRQCEISVLSRRGF